MIEKSLEYYQTLNNSPLITRCLYELGETVSRQGDYERARSLFTKSRAYARRVAHPWLIATVLIKLANLRLEECNAQQAAELAKESLALFRQQQDSRGVLSSQTTLAECHLALGVHAQASALLEEALK